MNKITNTYQNIGRTYLGFFLLAVVLLWIKTYVTQLTQFDLGIEEGIQEFLLILNPLGSCLLLLGLSFFSSGKKKYRRLLLIDFILSFILYANVLFYRFFNDYITLPTLLQVQNAGDVSSSLGTIVRPYDLLFFADIILLLALILFKFVDKDAKETSARTKRFVFITAITLSTLNLTLAEIDRPQLLTRGFDRNYIVKYLGMYNYTFYDTVQSTKASAQRATADQSDITDVLNYTRSQYAEPNPDTFGIGKEMNVIYLHLESIQTFLINYELHGEQVTPFLNSLVNEENTVYFDNFYHQTAQGKTSDAEFILDNSLYGLNKGSAFTTKGQNTYHAAPSILAKEGYSTAVLHGNEGSFWNRYEVYNQFGYTHFFDAKYYDIKEEDRAEYGLMDKPFYAQSADLIDTLPQPFTAKLIPVTHHFPYPLKEELATIEPHTTGDKSVDRYFQTARYADEALEEFFVYLKESGLYENSILVMYGDHYGISENHKRAMSEVLGTEVGAFETAQLQRVPLFIRVPGMEGGVRHDVSGQIDILPTVLHLLGIDSKKYVQFGTDLFSEEHREVIPFRNGDYVSPEIINVGDAYYDATTGLPIEDETLLTKAHLHEEHIQEVLRLSDKVVNSDLLRFYNPDDFQLTEVEIETNP